MDDNERRRATIQTTSPPLATVDAVRDHLSVLRQWLQWDSTGVLSDEGPTGILILLLKQDRVVATFRVCLDAADTAMTVEESAPGTKGTVLACWQGHTFTADQVTNLDGLSQLWQDCEPQSAVVDIAELAEFFSKVESASREKGRGDSIKGSTKQQVRFDAHGRCMFTGCGRDLAIDDITGEPGNFGYFAHNVASAEGGTRGIPVLSRKLSDVESNILLLCDTHHRLVDTVARVDYPAGVLSEMRAKFCRAASELLDGLSLPPVPVFCLSWPVHQQTISIPSATQIAQSLAPIGVRIDGLPHHLSDNDSTLRSAQGDALWPLLATQVNASSDRLLMQTHDHSYRAALFAMGLMPALIALGAKLGNKSEITPMLRHRESNVWYWPASDPRGEFWELHGVDSLDGSQDEVSISVALTAEPTSMIRVAESLGCPHLRLFAKSEYEGNGALGHPDDGNLFRQRMQELMHLLADKHGVRLVHILPCASNAACIFLGQAFDSHHPDWRIYDFAEDTMVARLAIRNESNACVVRSI